MVREATAALLATTRLTIDLHKDSDDVTISITLPTDDLPTIADTASNLPTEHLVQPADQQKQAQSGAS